MSRRGSKKRSEGQYAPLSYAMLKSPAWRQLSGAAMKVFLELHTRFNGGNNGKLHLSMNEAASILGMGKATVQRAFAELQAKGFLVLETPGNWYHRRAHEWRLTIKPVQGVSGKTSPTNDWRYWRPEKTERGSKSDPSRSRKVPKENLRQVNGSILEPVEQVSGRAFGSEKGH